MTHLSNPGPWMVYGCSRIPLPSDIARSIIHFGVTLAKHFSDRYKDNFIQIGRLIFFFSI